MPRKRTIDRVAGSNNLPLKKREKDDDSPVFISDGQYHPGDKETHIYDKEPRISTIESSFMITKPKLASMNSVMPPNVAIPGCLPTSPPLSISHSPNALCNREISLEECPNCGEIFSAIELLAHTIECAAAPHKKKEEEENDHCQFCLKLFPVSKLVAHAAECPEGPNSFSLSYMYHAEASNARGHPSPSLPKEKSIEQCPKCLKLFSISELISHCSKCDAPAPSPAEEEETDHCQFCLKLFPVSDLVAHAGICPERASQTDKVTPLDSRSDDAIERCMMCFCDFPISELVKHGLNCKGELLGSKERFKEFLPSVHDVDPMVLSVLTPTQQRAVDYVRERSKAEANDQYPDLCMRIIKLGYTPKDLQRVLHWVRHDAPIIIHLNLDMVLKYLVNDTHYRNLFETKRSGGSSDFGGRRGWEDRMFNKIYHSSPPVERVKYGVLNIVGDPNGVSCCYSYGDSFLQLKKVRLRTTFASMDTSSPSVKLSCCEHYGNVLNKYSDPELKAILDVATHKEPYLESKMITHYKEIQIHGPVCLSENVDCIVVSARHHENHEIKKLLDKFVEKNGCNLIWKDPSDDYHY